LLVGEATEVFKGTYLIAYVRYVFENDIMFCKPTDDGAMSLEVFNIINCLEENEIY